MRLVRPLSFGVLCGSCWAFFPVTMIGLDRPAGQLLTVLISGAAAGVATSYLLLVGAFLLRLGASKRHQSCKTGLLGVVSLLIGAFIFGALLAQLHLLLARHTGIAYRFAEQMPQTAPLELGLQYALGSILCPFSLLFVPLAIISTRLLIRTMAGVSS